ncbi:putative selenium delivery protein YdfZ [Salmonella enterica]
MMTYDRNRNAITVGSRVMISGTGHTGKITAIHADGLSAEQVRRGKTVEVEGYEGKFEPIELIRLGFLH